MPKQQHPFDAVAEKLQAGADRPAAGQEPSPDYWELKFAADEPVVGDYPQALPPPDFDWGDRHTLGADGFPRGPMPDQRLQPAARWTDVLSSNLWADGFLLNEKALAVFKQARLGEHREYPAVVLDHSGAPRPLTYVYIKNKLPPTVVDFARSEFYVTDMVSQPLPIGPVAIGSFKEWETIGAQVRQGKYKGCEEFSRLAYKRLVFLPDHEPQVDLFRLERLGAFTYISADFKQAIERSGITGLELKPNRRLFASS